MPILIFVFFATLLAGIPVFIALAFSSLLYTHFIAGIPDFVIMHRMAGGLDSFPLLAVPFFIFAGNLMDFAGSTKPLYHIPVPTLAYKLGRAPTYTYFHSLRLRRRVCYTAPHRRRHRHDVH